jgi:hypothetical protein
LPAERFAAAILIVLAVLPSVEIVAIHHVAMLEHFAERDHTTVSHVLTRELDGIASSCAEELSWTIPGFAGALEWPDADGAQRPC